MRQLRIAIIGSGNSGPWAAWLLDPHRDITLFEKDARPGGHARTVQVGGVNVDTGFIVCNQRTYPLFVPLMDRVGLPLVPSDMSLSASFQGGRYEYGTFSTRAMFARPMCLMDAGHWRLIRDILRFFRDAPGHHAHDGSIGDLLHAMGLGTEFRDRFLLSISGAIWSTPTIETMRFPASAFVRFFGNRALLSVSGQPQWLTVWGGSQVYVPGCWTRSGARSGCPARSTPSGATPVASPCQIACNSGRADSSSA